MATRDGAAAAESTAAREERSLSLASYDYDTGSYSRTVSGCGDAGSPAAQWFNKAMVWAWGFHHEEAIACFEQCLVHSGGKCAMAHWGIAYCASFAALCSPCAPAPRRSVLPVLPSPCTRVQLPRTPAVNPPLHAGHGPNYNVHRNNVYYALAGSDGFPSMRAATEASAAAAALVVAGAPGEGEGKGEGKTEGKGGGKGEGKAEGMGAGEEVPAVEAALIEALSARYSWPMAEGDGKVQTLLVSLGIPAVNS